MDIATHAIALVLRLLFHALSLWGLGLLILGRDRDSIRPHVCVLVSIGCLLASGAIAKPDPAQAIWSLVTLVVLVIVDYAFCRMTPSARNLILPAIYLCGVGVAMVFDPAPVGVPTDAPKHVMLVVAGMLAAALTAHVARRHLDALAGIFPVLLLLTVVLCALPLIPKLGRPAFGATSWLSIAGQSLQPSEFAKVTLALAVAAYLAANATRVSKLSFHGVRPIVSWRGVLPIAIVFCLALSLELLTNDLGTGIVMFALFASLLSLCSRRAGLLYGVILLACVVALVSLAVWIGPGHVGVRFAAWHDPTAAASIVINEDETEEVASQKRRLKDAGDHLLKASDAMANGGVFGTGLRFGVKRYYVPALWNDSVFAVIVEELGALGGLCVVLAVIALAVESARAARLLSEGSFERNMVLGSGCMLCAQALIIIGGITGMIPLTGVTLPFVSTGGSSILSCGILVGLMSACSCRERRAEDCEPFYRAFLLPAAIGASMVACMACVIRAQPVVRFCGDTDTDYEVSDVYTSDGTPLATGGSVYSGTKGREYPQGTLAAHVVGKWSDGLDARICSPKGRVDVNPILNVLAIPQKSKNTVLTLESSVQIEAEKQLKGMTGAIVAMDVKTGAVLAEASAPTYSLAEPYNPNPPEAVYYNRAVDEQYMPGSTFKIVTLAAALESGSATLDSEYTGRSFKLGKGEIINIGNVQLGDEQGNLTLRQALVLSSNTAFAELALEMGERRILETAEALGFNQAIKDSALDAVASKYVTDKAVTDLAFAWASVGQKIDVYGPSATVLQMCRVMAAIANGGLICQPYLVETGPFASSRFEPMRAISEETAQAVWSAMVEASGTDLDGMEVAGKTGTAQHGENGVLCWYICSAGDVAVACCVELESGTGADDAMPRATEVLRAAVDARS